LKDCINKVCSLLRSSAYYREVERDMVISVC